MPDMGIIKDMLHDYAHRAVDTAKGVVGAASSSNPDKPVASSAPASDWVSRAQKSAQNDRNSAIDKAISDNGG